MEICFQKMLSTFLVFLTVRFLKATNRTMYNEFLADNYIVHCFLNVFANKTLLHLYLVGLV